MFDVFLYGLMLGNWVRGEVRGYILRFYGF